MRLEYRAFCPPQKRGQAEAVVVTQWRIDGMPCSDPYINTLKDAGYNVVRLPKADIRPGQLLSRNGKDLSRLGELGDVLTSKTIDLPPVKADERVADLSGKRTGEMSIGVGLSLLGTIIGAIGGSKLGLDLKYERSRSATFEFQDVLEDRIDIVKLDAFLGQADVNPASAFVRELLFDDELYVVTATVKTTKLTIDTADESKRGVEVSVPEIQQLVGANVKVSGGATKTSKITYEGPTPLVFGFQAIQLDYDKGHYKRFKQVHAGDAALEAVQAQTKKGAEDSVLLTSHGPFVSLHWN
jgi:hypothetical protein